MKACRNKRELLSAHDATENGIIVQKDFAKVVIVISSRKRILSTAPFVIVTGNLEPKGQSVIVAPLGYTRKSNPRSFGNVTPPGREKDEPERERYILPKKESGGKGVGHKEPRTTLDICGKTKTRFSPITVLTAE